MRRLLTGLAVIVASASVAACGGDGAPSPVAGSGPSGVRGSIRVFAAASLTDALTEVAGAFESSHPGTTVQLSFGGSSSLREQILAGAPVDVFASADEEHMDRIIEAGEVDASEIFATNRLEIVVPAGNPAGVSGLDDFARDQLQIGLCAEGVPCGDLARRALDAVDVTPSPDTEEPDVRALLTKVEAGELDAGLVYATDVLSGGDRVEGIRVPADTGLVARYPIGAIAGSGNPELATAFIDFVLGSRGQRLLHAFGFGPP